MVLDVDKKVWDGFEYTMSKEQADFLLKARSGDDKKMRPQDYLIKYVNQEMGIKGTCVRVLTD